LGDFVSRASERLFELACAPGVTWGEFSWVPYATVAVQFEEARSDGLTRRSNSTRRVPAPARGSRSRGCTSIRAGYRACGSTTRRNATPPCRADGGSISSRPASQGPQAAAHAVSADSSRDERGGRRHWAFRSHLRHLAASSTRQEFLTWRTLCRCGWGTPGQLHVVANLASTAGGGDRDQYDVCLRASGYNITHDGSPSNADGYPRHVNAVRMLPRSHHRITGRTASLVRRIYFTWLQLLGAAGRFVTRISYTCWPTPPLRARVIFTWAAPGAGRPRRVGTSARPRIAAVTRPPLPHRCFLSWLKS